MDTIYSQATNTMTKDGRFVVIPFQGSGTRLVKVSALSENSGRKPKTTTLTVQHGIGESLKIKTVNVTQNPKGGFLDVNMDSQSITEETTASFEGRTNAQTIAVDIKATPSWQYLIDNLVILAGASGTEVYRLRANGTTSLCVTNADGSKCLGDIAYPSSLASPAESFTLGVYSTHSVSSQGAGSIKSIMLKDDNVSVDVTLPCEYDGTDASKVIPNIVLRFAPWVKIKSFTANGVSGRCATPARLRATVIPATNESSDPGASGSFPWNLVLDVDETPFELKDREIKITVTGAAIDDGVSKSWAKILTVIQSATDAKLEVSSNDITLGWQQGSEFDFDVISNTSWEIS